MRDKSKLLNNIYIIISLIIIVFGLFISIIAFSVNAQNSINSNTKNIKNIENDCDDTKKIIEDNKIRLAIIETHYEHITKQLDLIIKNINKK